MSSGMKFRDYETIARYDAGHGYIANMRESFRNMERLASGKPRMQVDLSELKDEIEPVAYRNKISSLIVESITSGRKTHWTNDTTAQLLPEAIRYASEMDGLGYSTNSEKNVRTVVNNVIAYLRTLRG